MHCFLYIAVLLLLSNLSLSLSLSVELSESSRRQPCSMGDQVIQQGRPFLGGARSDKTPLCPCCCFLPDNTFLPPNLIQSEQENSSKESLLSMSSEVNAVAALREIAALNRESRGDDKESKPRVLLVDTHGHAHLDRERHESYIDPEGEPCGVSVIISLSCAVEESDWCKTLEYAAQSDLILPAIGVHPWYLADLSGTWLTDLEDLLVKHPSAIVGEIGLCKMARFVRTHPEGKQAALLIQRQVFKDQMRLAGRLQRSVSVHCVKQHGVFMKVLKELVEEGCPCPTAVGMHSFTGTAHHVQDILKFENEFFPGRNLFYFGFSHIVNYEMCTSEKSRRQGREAVCAVPSDRLMSESDVHAAQDVAAGTAGSVAYIAECLEKPILEVAQLTAVNGLAFLKTVAAESSLAETNLCY